MCSFFVGKRLMAWEKEVELHRLCSLRMEFPISYPNYYHDRMEKRMAIS